MTAAKFLADVGTGLVAESAKSLLGKLSFLLGEQVVLAWGFKDNLKKFEKMINTITLMTEYAANNDANIRNPVLRDWLDDVKDLILDAEDVLDNYSYEMLSRKVIAVGCHRPRKNKALVWWGLSQLKTKTKAKVRLGGFKLPGVFRIRMANELKSLMKKWDDIIIQGKNLGIKAVEIAAAAAAPEYKVPETLQNKRKEVDFSNVVGRTTEKDTIIKLVCDASESSQNLSIIGIYGAAGLGKTTLCRSAFENDQVKKMFDFCIWISVSHAFQLDTILNEISAQLKLKITSTSRETVKQELQEKLKDKKYLLVLDDVWDTLVGEWESLKNVLIYLEGSYGTTVLVTSRSDHVLKNLLVRDKGVMREPFTYELGKLTEEQSKELFWQSVGHQESSDSEKQKVAQSLLERCQGVPLAIRTLGSMLRSQKNVRDWIDIEKSGIWSENDDVYPSVKLSFMYLSNPAVKKCFAFCGIFKEDQFIDKDVLIRLWMANGLLQSSDNDNMEHVGERYFDELLGNSLFQEPEFDVHGSLKKIYGCKMHDVVHKLATDILKQESASCSSSQQSQFYLSQFVKDDEVSIEQGDNKLRMLVLSGTCETLRSKVRLLDLCPRLDSKVRVLDLKCLRALSLENVGLKQLPNSIGILKHLRYLDISRNYDLRRLPNGLRKLHHLQTLRMLNICSLCRFPRKMNGLINLRHISDNSCEGMGIPEGLCMLSNLQTVPPLELRRNRGGSLRELKSLNKLQGKISLHGLENANEEEAREANLGSKQNIEDLHLGWFLFRSYFESCEEHHRVLDALKPHPNLRGLSIEGYKAETLPEWIMMLASNSNSLSSRTSLESLRFRDCKNVRRLEELASIYDLPRLQELRLGAFSDELDTVFPALPHPHSLNTPLSKTLRVLSLNGYGMSKVERLPPQIQYFIALEDFSIQWFPSVEEIPDWLCNLTSLQTLSLFGMDSLKRLPYADAMQQLTSLTTLLIHYCPILKKECAREIGPQWPKIQHILDVNFI